MSAKVTWSAIRRSIGRGDVLHAATTGAPLDGRFLVRRKTTRGLYVKRTAAQGVTENHFLPFPKAADVKVLDARTWIVVQPNSKTAWQVVSNAKGS
jgi:hypothetical protein